MKSCSIVTIFLEICLLIFGAHAKAQGKQNNNAPIIVASTTIIADIAKNIAGNDVNISCLLPVGSDPHLHDPTPQDVRLVRSATLILLNGLTLEGWMLELIKNSGSTAKIVTVSDGVDAIRSNQFHNATDPHAWMDPMNGLVYAKNIRRAFIELLPEKRSQIEENHKIYEAQLLDLDAYIAKQINKLPIGKRILITSHDAFHYYGRQYHITLESVLGTSTEAEVQTSDVIRIYRLLKEHQIPAIFIESTINPKLLHQIADDNHVKIGGKLFADSLSDEKGLASTYIKMLKYNTDQIVTALSGVYTSFESNKEHNFQKFILSSLAALMIIAFGTIFYFISRQIRL
ncbi:MAG: zinc ABC transporter substrate-binding protein [Saprospiraceae bacterium]|nr:zinc ABC transporter substrate-binding protein [Saprospiraceae bacterium]